jgi:hypothetical protein
MHGTKYQQCSSFVLGLGVLKLFITLNSYDWLRVHSVPGSISMVHQSSSNVCDPLMTSPCLCLTPDSSFVLYSMRENIGIISGLWVLFLGISSVQRFFCNFSYIAQVAPVKQKFSSYIQIFDEIIINWWKIAQMDEE